MLRLDVHRDAVAVAGRGMDQPLVEIPLAHDLLRLDAVLIGIALKIQIMQQADDAPEIHLVAVAELLREIAHDALDRAGMMQMERILVILRQQCPGFLPVQLLAHSKAS